MHLRLASVLSILFLTYSFAGDPVVINPNKDLGAYAKQLKAIKAKPSGQIVKFEGSSHPGFILKEVLGEGTATTIFRAVHAKTGEEVALRLPLITDAQGNTRLFDYNIKAAHELDQFQKANHRRLPVMPQFESREGFFATTPVLKPHTEFDEFKRFIESGNRTDPKFLRMERDFAQFMREMAEVEFMGDFHEGQLVWEDLGEGKGRWTVIDYGLEKNDLGQLKAIETTRSRTAGSIMDMLFLSRKNQSKSIGALLLAYRDQAKAALLAMRSAIPFATAQNPKPITPLRGAESQIEGTSTLICKDGEIDRESKTGRSSRNTLGKTGSTLSLALGLLQFLPRYNPFAQAVGVSCEDARKKLGRMICEWDFPLNPWNNVADCTVVTAVVPLGLEGESGTSLRKESVCQVDYRWVDLRLDDAASRERLKVAGYFNKNGVDVRDSKAQVPSAASLLKSIQKKAGNVTESKSVEELRFPPETRDSRIG